MKIEEQKQITSEAFFTALGMKKYGGSFVKNLGQIINYADVQNLKIIKKAWKHYWNEYLLLGIELYEKKSKAAGEPVTCTY